MIYSISLLAPHMISIYDIPNVFLPVDSSCFVGCLAFVPSFVLSPATLNMPVTDKVRVQTRSRAFEIVRVGAGKTGRARLEAGVGAEVCIHA